MYEKLLINKLIIPIVISTDNNYVLQTKVFLKSLFYSMNKDTFYDIYVFYNDLTELSKKSILKEQQSNIKISFVDVNNYLIGNKFYAGNYSIAMYHRLFAPIILKNYKKIIYCDVDSVANADFSELFNINLKDNVIGAINDFGIALDAKQNLSYFNSGLLVINTEKFVEMQICEKCTAYINSHQNCCFPDQDALNFVLEKKVLLLNGKYNYQVNVIQRNKKFKKHINQYYSIPKIKDLLFIHYNGHARPWYYSKFAIKDIFSRKWWQFAKKLSKAERKELKSFRIFGYNMIIAKNNNVFKLIDLNNDFKNIKKSSGKFYALGFYIKNYIKLIFKCQ